MWRVLVSFVYRTILNCKRVQKSFQRHNDPKWLVRVTCENVQKITVNVHQWLCVSSNDFAYTVLRVVTKRWFFAFPNLLLFDSPSINHTSINKHISLYCSPTGLWTNNQQWIRSPCRIIPTNPDWVCDTSRRDREPGPWWGSQHASQ